MDGDGQHDPAYLMEIVQPVLDGECDMCIGSRFVKKEGFQTSFMRRVGIRFLSGLIFLLSGHKVLDVTSGFRATNARMTAYFAQHYAIDYPEPEPRWPRFWRTSRWPRPPSSCGSGRAACPASTASRASTT